MSPKAHTKKEEAPKRKDRGSAKKKEGEKRAQRTRAFVMATATVDALERLEHEKSVLLDYIEETAAKTEAMEREMEEQRETERALRDELEYAT
jgi:hypothetical protein